MKIMRRVVKAAAQGQSSGDLTAPVNPEAVDEVARAAGQVWLISPCAETNSMGSYQRKVILVDGALDAAILPD